MKPSGDYTDWLDVALFLYGFKCGGSYTWSVSERNGATLSPRVTVESMGKLRTAAGVAEGAFAYEIKLTATRTSPPHTVDSEYIWVEVAACDTMGTWNGGSKAQTIAVRDDEVAYFSFPMFSPGEEACLTYYNYKAVTGGGPEFDTAAYAVLYSTWMGGISYVRSDKSASYYLPLASSYWNALTELPAAPIEFEIDVYSPLHDLLGTAVEFSLELYCDASSTSVTYNPDSTDITANVLDVSNSDELYFAYSAPTNSLERLCPMIEGSFQVVGPSATKDDLSDGINQEEIDAGGGKFHVQVTDPHTPGVHAFYFFMETEGRDNNGPHFSPEYTYTLSCGPTSTGLTPPAITTLYTVGADGTMSIELFYTQTVYDFPPFVASNPNCPVIAADYAVMPQAEPGSTALDYTATDLSAQVSIDPLTVTSGGARLYITVPYIGEAARLYKFRITGGALGGCVESTDDIRVNLLGSCATQSVQLEQDAPLNVTYERHNITSYQVDISDRFVTSTSHCPVTSYHLAKMVNEYGAELANPEQYVTLGAATGILDFIDFTRPLGRHCVYLYASNGLADSSLECAAVLEITEQQYEPGGPGVTNEGPWFAEELRPQTFEIGQDSADQYIYTFPEIKDALDDPVDFDILSGKEDFMNFEIEDGTLTMSLSGDIDESTIGTYKIEIELYDIPAAGEEARTPYEFQFEIHEAPVTQDDEIPEVGFAGADTDGHALLEWEEGLNHTASGSPGREKIELEVVEFTQNGRLELLFSEELHSIESIEDQIGWNLTTLNEHKDLFIDIQYFCNLLNGQDAIIPELQDWAIETFTNYEMVIHLNFTNPLYVSSFEKKDHIDLVVLESNLLTATLDSLKIESQYTLSGIEVPAQFASEEEFERIDGYGNNAKGSMIFSLIIPFCFMLFMSVSMNRVWGLYNMLQLESNFIMIGGLLIPANTYLVLEITHGISNFKLFADPTVTNWIKNGVFGGSAAATDSVFAQGTLILGIIFVIALLLLILLIDRMATRSGWTTVENAIARLKEKIMWSSVFRGQIQMFFPTAIAALTTFKERMDGSNQEEPDISSDIGNLLKISLLVIFPIFSFLYLRANQQQCGDEGFRKKFDALYTNLITTRDSVFVYTTIFCLRRIILALSTVFVQEYLIVSIYAYMMLCLLIVQYFINVKPMEPVILNYVEIINETYLLLTCYQMFVFSDWVADVDVRYSLGEKYMYLLFLAIFVNFVIIGVEMFRAFRTVYRKARWKSRWRSHIKLKQKYASIIINDMLRINKDLGLNLSEQKIARKKVELWQLSMAELKEKSEKASLASPADISNFLEIQHNLRQMNDNGYDISQYDIPKQEFVNSKHLEELSQQGGINPKFLGRKAKHQLSAGISAVGTPRWGLPTPRADLGMNRAPAHGPPQSNLESPNRKDRDEEMPDGEDFVSLIKQFDLGSQQQTGGRNNKIDEAQIHFFCDLEMADNKQTILEKYQANKKNEKIQNEEPSTKAEEQKNVEQPKEAQKKGKLSDMIDQMRAQPLMVKEKLRERAQQEASRQAYHWKGQKAGGKQSHLWN